ncbi:LytR family transcriptional regulator [Paenibacillus albiflavus]|uniref:LytR family transcriptional regulator n=2 Tax=Paenibacillus albiflavus TaxID=2545760 RepID=A0A4R4E5F8_9BACL|nr:LytR family transcriptional regulator [Paenibacillus albiflavus]
MKWILLSISTLILIVIGYYSFSIIQFSSKIHHPTQDPTQTALNQEIGGPNGPAPTPYQPPVWEGKERVNILLLGGDGRESNDRGRSDTSLILSIDPSTKKVSLFSLLRDTYVKIPGRGMNKLNAAFSFGGPELSMKTIEEFTGLPIHYYFYVDMDSFITLVDAIDGVDLEVEKDLKYSDKADKPEYQIDLKKGFQHLNGNQALQYARFRHDALSDYSRTERQRKLLKVIGEKLQSTTSLLKLPSILDKIAPYMTTNMDLGDMLKLANLGYHIRANTIETVQLPPMDLLHEEKIDGSDVITTDEQQIKKYITDIFYETKETSTN